MEPCSEQEEKTQILGWPNRGNLRGGNYTKSRILTSLHIPDVECEPHNSRKPEVYSSMKVTLKKQFLKQAWRSESWPSGALVSFFGRRRTPTKEVGPHPQT
ncbi:hypothetical protein JTB14_003592 [Gonioctena quinquepunctata]|nr:hypothetical protein JTB14_003592 [Gonioctena quinquepunctata]